MKVIIESGNTRRFINTGFRIYGTAQDLKIVASAIEKACSGNLAQGWVEVGESIEKDETLYPYEPTADEKPIYPFSAKEITK